MINIIKLLLLFSIVYSISLTYYGLQLVKNKVKYIEESQTNCEDLNTRIKFIEEKQNTLYEIITGLENLKIKK